MRGWSEMKKGACGRTFDKEQKGDQPHPVQSGLFSGDHLEKEGDFETQVRDRRWDFLSFIGCLGVLSIAV